MSLSTQGLVAWALLLAGLVGVVVGIVLPLQIIVRGLTPAVVTTGWDLPPQALVGAAIGVGSVPVVIEACILVLAAQTPGVTG